MLVRIVLPLRRVVRRRVHFTQYIPGYRLRFYRDTMECGHTVEVNPFAEGEKPAKRHRCNGCRK